MKKYFVGIDTSTTNTAVVVLDKQGDFVECFLSRPKSKDLEERIISISYEVDRFMRKYLNRYTIVGVESPAFAAKGMRDKLAMVSGLIYFNLKVKGMDIQWVSPSHHKKVFTGSGKAGKEETIECLPVEVKERFKEVGGKKIDDLADAYSIAYTISVNYH